MAGSNIIRRISRQRKLKQAKHDRRKAKLSMALMAQLPTAAEMEEACSTALANMNIRVRSILETDCPEAVPLIGSTMFETFKRFSDAGSRETLQKALEQCEEEIETMMVTAMVWMARAPFSADTTEDQPMFS